MTVERKYQQEGGPLLRDGIGLLREWSRVAALDIRDFLDGLIINVLIGNADAHGKNYAMLYHMAERKLAPLSKIAAEVDVYQLTHRLLRRSQAVSISTSLSRLPTNGSSPSRSSFPKPSSGAPPGNRCPGAWDAKTP
jgi:hypothetical protein